MTDEILNKINETVDHYVRPSLQIDGGDITIIGFKDNILNVRFAGSCSCCPHARATLEHLVADAIHQHVSPDITVRLA